MKQLPFGAYWRAILLFGHIGAFVVTCFFRNLIWGRDLNWTLKRRQRLVSKRLLTILNAELVVEGNAPEGTCIFIANHRSYLDPVVMHRDLLFCPVAKAEVSKWPLIGYGAQITGVLYVQRDNRESRYRTREAMVETIKGGNNVCIYPEGTTHINPTTIEFRKGTFRIAAENLIPVVPIALDYGDPADAWIGDDTFVPHLLRVCAKKYLKVYLAYGEPIIDSDPDRLLAKTKRWIDEKMLSFHQSTQPVGT